MAETKPKSLLEIGLAKSKEVAEYRKKTTSTTPTSGQPVVEKRGETPEERATYARLMGINDLGASGMALELSKMDSAKEKMNKSAANVAKLQSKMQPQEHDPLKVDSGRIMQQNITQRAAQKVVDEPTSVEGVEDKSKAAAKHLGLEPYILKPDVQSRKAMRDVFDSTDPLYESQGLAAAFKYIDTLPTNEEGKIVVDGVPYSRMELAQGLAPQIVAENSGSLFANNATYRDDMAKRMGYKNMDSYLAALDQRLAAMQSDLANHVSAQHAIQTPFNDMAGLEALATQERAGAKVLRDLRDQIKSMRAGEGGFEQFFKGLNEGFDAVNMATLGIADLASEYKQNIVYNKMLNGETLTPEERILADALNVKSDLDALREAQGQSWYNNIGTGVGYIGEIAPQFVGPMLAAKGLFKPINVGAKGAWQMTKKAASKGFTNALKTGLGATARVGGKSLNNIARFQINGMLTAPLQASTYSRFLEKRNAQYSIKDGKVTYTPTDAWRDLVDTWIEQGAEVGSELFGVSLEKFTSASLAAIGRNIGLGKVLRKIGGSVRDVETSKAMRFVKSGATKAGQQLFGYAGGVLPETLSEIYGDLTSEMFKSVLTGNGNFEEFKNPTYWATAFALSGIYGGAMSVLPSMVDYASYMRDISALGDIKKKILSDGKIEHTDLKNALIALSAGGSIKDTTAHLAELDWKNGGYSLEEIGYAMDYIRAEAMQQVRMGEAAESQRLQRFGNVAQNIEAHAYRDEDGTPSGSMVMAVDKDGNSYHILEGDYSNKEATLKALNSEGKVVPLLASNIEGLSKASIADVTLFYYQQMFSTEFNLQRLESAEYAIERMDNPTMAQVADVAKRVGIVMPKEGDTITLVDGRTAKVTSISDDLGIMAEMTDGEGNLSVVPIPIMQILSSNTYIAEAQKLQNAEDALELAQAEEAQTEVEDAVEEGDATAEVATEEVSNGIIGTEVTLPNGNKGTIVEVDGDDVVVDTGRGVDAYEVYSKEELGMTETEELATPQPTQTTAEQTTGETATEQTTGEVTPEQATEALNEIAGIKPVPTLEDGSIDYEAIDDAETFAKHFEHDMGSREEAINSVQEMREQAVADLAEAEKKGKKARTASEKVANKKAREKLAERIAFYDNVLDIYTPKAEAPATPIESTPQVDTTPSQTEAQSPTEAAEGVQPSETTAEEQADGYSKYNEKLERPVGLQHNELSEQLEENTRRMINDVAAAFGVEVIFQREVRSSAGNLVNGKIEGSTVYFNWGIREHTLTWLMGHEFTHRMKSLSPEAYEKLRDAVRAYLGEGKWNRLIEKQRKIYEERENPEEILTSAESAAIWEEAKEQTKRKGGSYNAEAAKKLYNKKVAEARREAYIEEVVCDEVGVLAREHKAFDRFLRSEHVRNDGKFLRWLRKVWQSLKGAFIHDVRTFNKVMKTLDELINVSTAEVAKGAKPTKGGEKKSLSAPVFYSNAQYAVQNIKQEKATPEQWLKMIEKNGGLKAGEDKWLGLSDWLKASDKKTLTKDEVLQYIAENDIQIEEVEYGDIEDNPRFKELEKEYQSHYSETYDTIISFERMAEKYGEDFELAFEASGMNLYPRNEYGSEDAQRYLGVNEINSTRRQYTTDGLTNKREIALTVPTIEPWNTSDNIHFGDAGEGRAVAWVRFGETTDADGKRVLVIDEIQSKRHQDGREKGYKNETAYRREKTKLDELEAELFERRQQLINKLEEKYGSYDNYLKRETRGWRTGLYPNDEVMTPEEIAEYNATDLESNVNTKVKELKEKYLEGVPSAPFEKNWAELAMKRMLRYAAENGYDYVAWTTGDQQADRYDIGSVVKDIVAYDTKDADGNPIKKMKFRMNNMGTYNIATNVEGVIVKGDGEMKEGMRLSDITGKALAEKIMNGEGEDAMVFENGKDIEAKSLEGEELHIGNEGMKAFYDQMLPSFVKKYTKKWGAEVGEVTMPDLEENNTMHAVNVTDSMRESVMQGQPKYSLQETNDRFNAELDAFKAGTHKGLLHLGYPSEILKVCGVGARELTISPRELSRHLKKHNLTTDDLKDLVYAIQEPIMVYKHGKKHPNIVVITEVMVNNGKLSVSIELDEEGNVVEISNISSVHSKDALTELDRLSELSDEELKKALKWVDKEKVSGWLMPTPYMGSGASLDPKHLSTANIIQNFQNPKIEAKNSLITPEMDATYLDAVERGDMATAQRMVMEAAKLAMPNTKVVDEDGNPKVVYHGGQFGISSFIPKRNMHFGTKKAAMQRILDEQWGYDNWLVQNEDGSFSWKYEDEYDEAYNVQSNKTFATEEEAMADALLYFGNEVVVKPYFLNIRHLERTDDAQSSWDDAIEVVKAEGDNVDGIVYENWYEDKGSDSYVAFEPNQIKSADPVTYDVAGNIIPLSERFNPKKEDIRYSMSEETTQIFDAAKAKFGTTYDMREAGYILPDGSMLDFSGRHQVRGGDTSFLNGDRTVDHREISDIAYDADDNETGISTDLGDFLDRGAIRIDSNAGAINLNVAPTKAQKDRLKRLIERNDGYVYVDFGKGWDTEHYAEYEAARASRVLGDIDRYFDEGIKPTGNVRYSLSDRPTGLFNDFAEEFEALQKWYESLDTTTIHAQHPYRIRKRKVVQKYLNYVSKVLGHNVENIVYDKTNNSHIKKLYDKLKPYLKGTKEEDYSVFVESLRNRENQANYIVGSNIITHEISDETAFMDAANTLRAYIHENVHRIIEKLGVDEKTLEDILAEGLSLKPDITQSYIANYLNDPKHEQGEETLAYAIGDRISYSEDREKLLNAIEGNIAAKELFESQKISVPLRDSYIEKIINELHNEYKSRREGEDSTGADSANRGEVNKVDNQGLWREYSEAGSSGDIGRGGRVLAPTRYSLQSGDMPFFNDNGDIITFDNTDITGEDYDAVELRSPMPTTPRTTEDVINAHLSARHNAAKERIRRESRVLRDAVRKQYREEQVRRREGVESMRTNAAKVDYIIGAPIETLDYEAQVLAMIAMGTLSISWESLSNELGVKSGDKKSYRHITNGATATLDAVVHAWWESINGYENGIDTQDLRNALIDVLMQVPTAKGALSILEDRFDHALRNRDEALEDIDREEDRLIAEEDARYNEQMTTLSDPARMSEYVRQYEQTVGFHEELTAIEGTLRKMDSELKAVRKRAERAQVRSRASKQKQSASFKEVREAITESKRALLEALSTYEQLGFNKQEVRSLVDAVNKARSMADINKVRVKIENVILNVSIREKRRHMDQMLNLRLPSGELVETWVSKQIHDGKMSVADGKRILADMFRGTNANGVRVAKYVDDETARVMDFLRNNLVVPNHGGHYQDKVDADGNIIGREYVPSREVTEGADELMASNEKKMNVLLEKKINGDITEEKNIELLARQLYTPYLFAANARANVKEVRAEGEKMYEDIQRKKAEMGDAYTKEMRDADYAALEANSLHLVEAKTAYDEALTEYNETLGNVIMEGRDNLRMFREGKEAHKAEVVGMAIKAIGGEAKETSDGLTVWERISRGGRKSIGVTYWTFDTACREIDRFAPNGEGEFYKHFMGGWREASNAFFTRTENHVLSICEAVGRITGSGKDSRRALRKFIETADWTDVGKIRYKNSNGRWEETHLKISNALFVLAMWDQAQYRDIMTKRGVTQEVIDSITAKIASIDEHYLDFKDWVVQEFLPTTRLEYNEVHKQVFGASMDNIENYFPAKVVKGYAEEDLNRGEQLLPSTITGSIITRKSHSENIKYNQSFFSVLLNHLQNMDQWASFTPLVEDLTAVLSSPEFSRLANEYKPGVGEDKGGAGSLKQILRETGAIAVGSYTSKADDADAVLRFMTGAWAASNITFRFSTALKQMSGLSAVFTSGLGMTQAYFAKNLFRSIGWAYKNSPMFKKRWGDGVAGNEALLEKYSNRTDIDLKRRKIEHLFDKAKEYLRLLTVNMGMFANRAVDAWVTAVTMRTVYDVTLREITKGKPETATEEQKSYAMMKAEIFANETQQSSEGAYLSVPQIQRSVATAAATVYMNAPFAANRLRVQGVQDIYRWLNSDYRNEINTRYGDGAARKAASKGLGRLAAGISIDASFILMSQALGQGLWNLIIDWFDDTEDDDDEAEPINWKKIGLDVAIQIATGGYLWLSQIPSLAGGHRPSLAPPLTELFKGVMNFLGWNEYKLREGDFSIDLYWWALGETMFKYGLGVDPETMLNIARGIEGICIDKDPMAAMKLLNTPQSMVNIIAGPRRNNETVKEYVERRARLEVLFAQPKYSELYNDEGKFIGKGKYDVVGGAKDYRLNKLFKEYNERQRATVMSKYLSPSEITEFERIDSEYKAIVEPLGWEVGKNPVDDMVDKTTKRYKYPNGLTNVHYAALKEIATAAERTRRAQDRWVGSDKGYADLVREEYNLREQLIAGRRSSHKAKTVKEKIDRAEKQRKKNQKK